MKRNLEKFQGKVVQFRLKPFYKREHPNRDKWPDIGIVKMNKGCIFFQNGRLSRFDSLAIFSGKNAELHWKLYKIDMRTIKELPEEEQVVWKLEHNM